jgi:hypothetical protein
VAPKIREAVAQRGVARADAARERRACDHPQAEPCNDRESDYGYEKPADHVAAEPRIACLPDQQPGERRQAECVRCDRPALWRARFAPDHAHRGNVL